MTEPETTWTNSFYNNLTHLSLIHFPKFGPFSPNNPTHYLGSKRLCCFTASVLKMQSLFMNVCLLLAQWIPLVFKYLCSFRKSKIWLEIKSSFWFIFFEVFVEKYTVTIWYIWDKKVIGICVHGKWNFFWENEKWQSKQGLR